MLSMSAKTQKTGNDQNTSPSNREAAEETVDNREQEKRRFRTQIEERERARPLWERVKDIFKKYGVTVTAVMLAAGTVIGAVIGTTTISLKSSAKGFGNGLNEIGKKKPPARPHRLESKLYLPSRCAGDQLFGHTHMAVDPGRGVLLD